MIHGGQHINDELTYFEEHIPTLEVPVEKRIFQLELLLEGEVLTAYLTLLADQMLHYMPIKEVFCLTLEISAESYQK